ncbi:MAG: BatA domain-containing protein, partial [Pirellulaceae bacterium]|nr:BatA domain-containing protein [Pirellulaceae bacterium]
MSFVNASLLLGGLLVGVPVVLHLLMRQQPRQLVFPAIRYVEQRRESNRRTLQLRHWLLLALRCLVVGFLVLALARPSVGSAALGGWLLSSALVGLAGLAGVLAVVAWVWRR